MNLFVKSSLCALAFSAAATTLANTPVGAAPASATAPVTEVQLREKLKGSNCLACHAPERKLVGPSFADIAKRYADKPAEKDALVKAVRRGGSGNWGPIPMPANPQLSEEQAQDLVQAILRFSPSK